MKVATGHMGLLPKDFLEFSIEEYNIMYEGYMDKKEQEFKDQMFFNTHLYTSLGMFQTDSDGQETLDKNFKDFIEYEYYGKPRTEDEGITKDDIQKKLEHFEKLRKKND